MNRFPFACAFFYALSCSALLGQSGQTSTPGTATDPARASMPGFVAVAPNHQYLVLEGGLRDVRSGRRAMHILIDPPADSSLHGSLHQTLAQVHGGERFTAAIWHRGTAQNVTLGLKCFDEDSRIILQKAKRTKPSTGKWQPTRIQVTLPNTCVSVDFWIEVSGPGSISLDDAAWLDSHNHNDLTNPGFEEGWKAWRQGDQNSDAGLLWINDAPFVPWGMNYDRTILAGRDVSLEETPLEKIDRDFREARRIGANSVRLFLQPSAFMPIYGVMDEGRLQFFDQVVWRARKYNLRIDVTGLSQIVVADLPEWYSARTSEEILNAERLFWETIARRYSNEAAILMYDLQNEPFVAATDGVRKPIGCFTMSGGRQFCYCHPHSPSIPAAQWTKAMVEGIRRYDTRHLITIGLLPGATPVFGGANPGFSVPAVAPFLDVICIHLYPSRPAPQDEFLDINKFWLEMVLRYASGFGKPVIVEEWFPIFRVNAKSITTADWFPRFMDASERSACGWFTFYHALLVDGVEKEHPLPIPQIELFARHAEEMRNLLPARKPGTTTLEIDPADLWKNRDKVQEVLKAYRDQRRAGADVDFTWDQRP